METRQITEVKMFYLVMNPMTSRVEDRQICCISYEKQRIVNWYKYHECERYVEEANGHSWAKSFRKGCVLEWFNPIDSFDRLNHYGQGICEEWVRQEQVEHLKIEYLFV